MGMILSPDSCCRIAKTIVRLFVLEVTIFIRTALCDSYCWYRDKHHGNVKQIYCEGGCCSERGDKDDICCFKWSVGVILGICIGGVVILAGLFIIIFCCYKATRKRNRTSSMIATTPPSTSVVYNAATGYVIPHPPSAFYPSSQFPNAPPAIAPSISSSDDLSNSTPTANGSTDSYMASFKTPYPYMSHKMNGHVS